MDENIKNDDIKKMLEAAHMISQMISSEESNEKNPYFNFDYEQIVKAMEMVKNLDIKKEAKEAAPVCFDEQIQSTQMKAIKSAIPYLSFKEQKYFGLMVKFMEIKNLLELYKDEDDTSHTQTRDNVKILNSIKPYVDEEKQRMIDMCIKMIEMKKIIECFDFKQEDTN